MILPMLFGTAKIVDLISDVEKFVEEPDLFFEQKLDGARLMVVIQGGLVSFHNRRGDAMKHTASTQHFEALTADLQPLVDFVGPNSRVTLDGELMHDTGTYYVFDLPELHNGGVPTVNPTDPFWVRRSEVSKLVQFFGPSVRLVKQFRSPADKRELVRNVIANEGEGVIVKNRTAPYESGQRVKHSLKVKIVRSVDVVVTAVDRPDPRHGNFEFGLFADRNAENPTVLGTCSAIGKPDAKPFDVIEVEFLGWVPGGGLREPRMVKLRDDKSPRECTVDQLRAYSKAVL